MDEQVKQTNQKKKNSSLLKFLHQQLYLSVKGLGTDDLN